MTKDQELLAEALYVLNMIPNHRGVCKDGSSSYDLASKIGRRIDPILREKRYLDNPDRVVYQAESGQKYTYRGILELAKGNGNYAMALIDRAEWQHIETIIEEDLREGEIAEYQGTYKLLK